MVNNALKMSFDDIYIDLPLSKTNEFIDIILDKGKFIGDIPTEKRIQFACFFTNVGGKGELEDILKEIKNNDSSFADCLQEWQKCLGNKDKTLSDKEMIKFWIEVYKRFDVLDKSERKDDRNWEWNNFLKNNPNAFDFSNTTVPEFLKLKEFLHMFA